jgi:hypothetical protein
MHRWRTLSKKCGLQGWPLIMHDNRWGYEFLLSQSEELLKEGDPISGDPSAQLLHTELLCLHAQLLQQPLPTKELLSNIPLTDTTTLIPKLHSCHKALKSIVVDGFLKTVPPKDKKSLERALLSGAGVQASSFINYCNAGVMRKGPGPSVPHYSSPIQASCCSPNSTFTVLLL